MGSASRGPVCCPDNYIRVYKVATGELLRKFRTSVKVLKTALFNVNHSLVAANYYVRQGGSEIWDVHTGAHDVPGDDHPWFHGLNPYQTKDSKWHIEWSNKEIPPRLVRLGGGQAHSLHGHMDKVSCVVFSHDERIGELTRDAAGGGNSVQVAGVGEG
jgi:hypothetical protein